MKKALFITVLLAILTLPAYATDLNLESPVIPHRVFDMSTGEIIDFERLLEICADADVVAQGEQHGDPATHMMELAILYGLNRHKDGKVALSMEMFERHQQEALDKFLNREISEVEFESSVELSSTYQRDYRPLIRFCRKVGLPVIAANLPWDIGIQVAIHGIDLALNSLSEEQRTWAAEEYSIRDGVYRDRHHDIIKSTPVHGMGMEMTDELIYKYYMGQSLKDDTMAESIALFVNDNPGWTVYQIVGAFHVNDHLGMFEKIQDRLSGKNVILVAIVPVVDINAPLDQMNNLYTEEFSGCDYMVVVPDYREEPPAEY